MHVIVIHLLHCLLGSIYWYILPTRQCSSVYNHVYYVGKICYPLRNNIMTSCDHPARVDYPVGLPEGLQGSLLWQDGQDSQNVVVYWFPDGTTTTYSYAYHSTTDYTSCCCPFSCPPSCSMPFQEPQGTWKAYYRMAGRRRDSSSMYIISIPSSSMTSVFMT